MKDDVDSIYNLSETEINLVIKHARTLRWFYGLLLPVSIVSLVIYILWCLTENDSIVIASIMVLSLVCLLIAHICFRKASALESSVKKKEAIASLAVEKTKSIFYEDPEVAVNHFWATPDLAKSKIISNNNSWFYGGGGAAFLTVALYGKGLTESTSVIVITFFMLLLIMVVFKVYMVFRGIKDVTISNLRYQNFFPMWAVVLDRFGNFIIGHALFFALFTFFKILL